MAAIAPQLIGESPEFHTLLDWISDLASLDKPILITGERGTGKELVASRLHFLSPRWEQTYHSINCAAYDDESFNEQLYDAVHTDGLLDRMDGGTLFLDNVDRLSRRSQERLVRVIEYNEYHAGDGSEARPINIRFIASLSGGIRQAVEKGRISEDFIDRVTFDAVHIPPLRVRKPDISPLLIHFGRKIVTNLGAESFPGVTPEAMEVLYGHNWPGNVRELKNVIERSTARAFLRDETLQSPISEIILDPLTSPWDDTQAPAEIAPAAATADIDAAAPPPPETKDFSERVFIFERGLIDEAMRVNDHHQGKAAEYLNLTYHQFRGLLRKHGLKK